MAGQMRTRAETKPPILERIIATLSPKWAFDRQLFRSALSRNYDAGANDRFSGNWMPVANATAEETAAPYRDRIRGRARDLERNNDLVIGALDTFDRNVVGSGIRPQAAILKAGGDQNERLNEQAEALWKHWAKPGNCDTTGQSTFYELESLAMRRKVTDGEIFIRRITPKKEPGKVPLLLQMLEPDLLDTVKTDNGKNKVYGGVEVNEFGRPVAYWFAKEKYGESSRIPADQVLHLFKKTRAIEFRGVSELVPVIQRARHSGEAIDAELLATRLAACFAGFIKTGNPHRTSLGRQETSSTGDRLETIEPGTLNYLSRDEDVVFSSPGRPNTSIADFVKMLDRRAGAAIGLSYEAMTRDLSKGSYSSARQGYLEDRRTYRRAQQYLVDHLCQPVWEWFIEAAYLAGLLKIPNYYADPERFTSARWLANGWEWIDPMKEVQANEEAIKSGQLTLEETCGARGRDWREVLEQRQREQKYAAELGLVLDFGSTASNNNGTGGGDDDEEDGGNGGNEGGNGEEA